MKPILAVVVLMVALLSLAGSEAIKVEAKFIEAPAKLKVTAADCANKSFLEKRGVQVLSAPKVLTRSGVEARVFVGQDRPVRGPVGEPPQMVPEGIALSIVPKWEGQKIRFSGNAVVRRAEETASAPGCDLTEFTATELHFSGTCKHGESVLLSPRATSSAQRVHVFLTFFQATGE